MTVLYSIIGIFVFFGTSFFISYLAYKKEKKQGFNDALDFMEYSTYSGSDINIILGTINFVGLPVMIVGVIVLFVYGFVKLMETIF